MSVERANAVGMRGTRYTLLGPELKVGAKAPDFKATGKNMQPVQLSDTSGKVRIFSVIPSLDTPVCDAMTRRFNREASHLPGVQIFTISMDLPFAQTRWCATTGVDHVEMISDHLEGSFGKAYGTLIKEMRLESRAIFVLDEKDVLQHVEYVPEVGDHPDYEAALEAVRGLTK